MGAEKMILVLLIAFLFQSAILDSPPVQEKQDRRCWRNETTKEIVCVCDGYAFELRGRFCYKNNTCNSQEHCAFYEKYYWTNYTCLNGKCEAGLFKTEPSAGRTFQAISLLFIHLVVIVLMVEKYKLERKESLSKQTVIPQPLPDSATNVLATMAGTPRVELPTTSSPAVREDGPPTYAYAVTLSNAHGLPSSKIGGKPDQ
ncbi:hypothetical protein HDE_10824 [Halotydeus destructor]|nr:hypothetical protein HDE_10824 [Halotydeus destructor]